MHKIYLGIIRKTLAYALMMCWAITQQVVLKETGMHCPWTYCARAAVHWLIPRPQTDAQSNITPNMFQHHPYLPILDLVKKLEQNVWKIILKLRTFHAKSPRSFMNLQVKFYGEFPAKTWNADGNSKKIIQDFTFIATLTVEIIFCKIRIIAIFLRKQITKVSVKDELQFLHKIPRTQLLFKSQRNLDLLLAKNLGALIKKA